MFKICSTNPSQIPPVEAITACVVSAEWQQAIQWLSDMWKSQVVSDDVSHAVAWSCCCRCCRCRRRRRRHRRRRRRRRRCCCCCCCC